MGKVIKILILVLVIGGIAWVVLGFVTTSCETKAKSQQPKLPDVSLATYSVYIENTGNLLFTAKYELYGTKAGSRVYLLHGYWEMMGKEFRYIDKNLPLDEKIYGLVTVKPREAAKNGK